MCSDLFCLFVYRENLERLLDDKHFKEEIVHFNISEETGVIDASHRVKLIPLLMRYVHLCVCVCVFGSVFPFVFCYLPITGITIDMLGI